LHPRYDFLIAQLFDSEKQSLGDFDLPGKTKLIIKLWISSFRWTCSCSNATSTILFESSTTF